MARFALRLPHWRPTLPRMTDRIVVAVHQSAPVLLDRDATVERVREAIAEAGRAGARLVLFPEAIVPGYPRGLDFGARVGSRDTSGRELFARYLEQAVAIPGPETQRIGDAAQKAGCNVAIGLVERAPRNGTLYCTLAYFGSDGGLIATHRKLKPTGSERLIWGEGDGSGLGVIDVDGVTVGGLICWENLMPLARAALYAKGVDIWLAPTADARDTWQATIRHIACEGRCFVLSCNQHVTRDMLPGEWIEAADADRVECRGGSAIIGPLGDYLAGPLHDAEGLLTAELDMRELARARFDFDPVGHYSRPDVFRLVVNEAPTANVDFVPAGFDGGSPLAPADNATSASQT
jgi:nitrilase